MPNRYLAAFARFGGTLLAGGIILRLLANAFPEPLVSPVSQHFNQSVGALALSSLLGTAEVLGRSLLIALPLALLAGIPAGLRPGGRLDRILQLPAVVLAGVPALPLLLLCLSVLTARTEWLNYDGSVYLALGLSAWPWLTLAIRDGLASAASGPAAKVPATLGAILSQTGNLTVAAMAAGLFLVPSVGALRDLDLAVRLADSPLLFVLIAWGLPVVAFLQLLGAGLSTLAGASARQPGRLSLTWLVPGLLMAAALPFAGLPALVSLGMALMAALLGAAGGLLLALPGLWAPELTPVAAAPALLAPLLTGMLGAVLWGESPITQAIAIGIGCMPAAVIPVRRILLRREGDRPFTAAAGALLLIIGQALTAEISLGILSIGVSDNAPTLGALINRTLVAPGIKDRLFLPTLLTAAGMAGLSLIGHALRDKAGDHVIAGLQSDPESGEPPTEEVPVEPGQNGDGAPGQPDEAEEQRLGQIGVGQ